MRSFLRTLLILLGLASCGEVVFAQAIQIRLVNGKNGRPMKDSYVNVWVGNKQITAMPIPTDENGIAHLRLTDKDSEVNVGEHVEQSGGFSVKDPVVKYSNLLRVNAGYVLCVPHGGDYSWLSINNFSTDLVIQKGVVTPNSCGKATVSPEPGELIIFVRPLTFWEEMKE